MSLQVRQIFEEMLQLKGCAAFRKSSVYNLATFLSITTMPPPVRTLQEDTAQVDGNTAAQKQRSSRPRPSPPSVHLDPTDSPPRYLHNAIRVFAHEINRLPLFCCRGLLNFLCDEHPTLFL